MNHMQPPEKPIRPPTLQEVYHSPEFKAFCARFGIAWGMPTMDLTIRLPFEGSMEVTQTYRGVDHGAADTPQVVDTTTMHNEKYRTVRPLSRD